MSVSYSQAPIAGWLNPYEYVLLIVAIAHLALFLLWEAKWATTPVLPLGIWKVPSCGALMLVLFCVFMSVGTYIVLVRHCLAGRLFLFANGNCWICICFL